MAPTKKQLAAQDEAAASGDRLAQLLASDVMTKIHKQYGDTILLKAADAKIQQMPRLPTGIFMLDAALGGGFPVGRVSMVYGPKSASKTTTLTKTLAMAQRLCSICYTPKDPATEQCSCGKYQDVVAAYIDVEGTFDKDWARTLGVDLDRLLLSVPDYAEQALDILEALVRSGQCDIVVLDSIAFLTPMKEIEESVEKETMGVQARLIGKAMRKLISALNAAETQNGRRPTILTTNQIRMKLGVMFGNPETVPGGMASGFANSVEVKLWPGKYEMDEASGRPVHVEMNFRVEKNKTSVAKMEGTFRIMLSDTETKKKGEIFDENLLINQAERLGLIEKKSNVEWVLFGESYRGRSLIERRAMTDKAFCAELREKTLMVMLAAV